MNNESFPYRSLCAARQGQTQPTTQCHPQPPNATPQSFDSPKNSIAHSGMQEEEVAEEEGGMVTGKAR